MRGFFKAEWERAEKPPTPPPQTTNASSSLSKPVKGGWKSVIKKKKKTPRTFLFVQRIMKPNTFSPPFPSPPPRGGGVIQRALARTIYISIFSFFLLRQWKKTLSFPLPFPSPGHSTRVPYSICLLGWAATQKFHFQRFRMPTSVHVHEG